MRWLEEPVEDYMFREFSKNITQVDGRYSLALPLKQGMKEQLVSNRASALKRLQSVNSPQQRRKA